MAWDTDLTKERLFAAATAEFSSAGFAGARMDRIAAAAGVNKERIYQYFGPKEALFDAVLAAAGTRASTEVPIEGTGPSAIGNYAGRLLDRNLEIGSTARLQFWEGLERGGHVVELASRKQQWSKQLDALQLALPGIRRADAAELLLTVVTLCDAWPVLQHMDEMMAGSMKDRFDKRRAFIVRLVTQLAESFLWQSSSPAAHGG